MLQKIIRQNITDITDMWIIYILCAEFCWHKIIDYFIKIYSKLKVTNYTLRIKQRQLLINFKIFLSIFLKNHDFLKNNNSVAFI